MWKVMNIGLDLLSLFRMWAEVGILLSEANHNPVQSRVHDVTVHKQASRIGAVVTSVIMALWRQIVILCMIFTATNDQLDEKGKYHLQGSTVYVADTYFDRDQQSTVTPNRQDWESE